MRASASTAMAALLLAGSALVTVGAAAASASGTPTCASQSEFQHVSAGMTRTQVHQVFGIDGTLFFRNPHGGHVDTIRHYRPCSGSYVTVSYTDSRVTRANAS
jgi:hypothetical protein